MLILPGWTKEPCHSNSSKQASQLWSFKWNQWATLSHSHCRINWAENQETYMTPVINSPWKETHTLSNESCRWNKASSSRNTNKIKLDANQLVCGFSVIWFIEKKGNVAKRIVGTKAEQYHIQDNHTPDMLQTFPCIPKITSMPPHINCIGANLIMQKK